MTIKSLQYLFDKAVKGRNVGAGLRVLFCQSVRADGRSSRQRLFSLVVGFLIGILLLLWIANAIAALAQEGAPLRERPHLPPRVVQAQRFLGQRGRTLHVAGAAVPLHRFTTTIPRPLTITEGTGSTATWQPLGPAAVNTPNYGLVTGRVSSIVFDPADSTGNRV